MEMVERVAQAILTAHWDAGRGRAPSWDSLARADQDVWRSYARAAIAAMREPTVAMTEAASTIDVGICGEYWLGDATPARIRVTLRHGAVNLGRPEAYWGEISRLLELSGWRKNEGRDIHVWDSVYSPILAKQAAHLDSLRK